MESAAAFQVAQADSSNQSIKEWEQTAVREAQHAGVTYLDLIRAHLELPAADDDSGALNALLHATHKRIAES